ILHMGRDHLDVIFIEGDELEFVRARTHPIASLVDVYYPAKLVIACVPRKCGAERNLSTLCSLSAAAMPCREQPHRVRVSASPGAGCGSEGLAAPNAVDLAAASPLRVSAGLLLARRSAHCGCHVEKHGPAAIRSKNRNHS